MQPSEITITVKTLSGESASLVALHSDTVAAFKERVWTELLRGSGASMFHLILHGTGKQVPVVTAAGADVTIAELFKTCMEHAVPTACSMHVVLRSGGREGVMPDVRCEGTGEQ
jgi:hypothetical protein